MSTTSDRVSLALAKVSLVSGYLHLASYHNAEESRLTYAAALVLDDAAKDLKRVDCSIPEDLPLAPEVSHAQ